MSRRTVRSSAELDSGLDWMGGCCETLDDIPDGGIQVIIGGMRAGLVQRIYIQVILRSVVGVTNVQAKKVCLKGPYTYRLPLLAGVVCSSVWGNI